MAILLASRLHQEPTCKSAVVVLTGSEDTPDNLTETSFEAYCALFSNPKNKSGYRFITDQTESTCWVILKDGRSEYGRYSSVQEALEEAFKANLNL
jgi:hypothetical protein